MVVVTVIADGRVYTVDEFALTIIDGTGSSFLPSQPRSVLAPHHILTAFAKACHPTRTRAA
jgi:hypothetical protein